MAYSRCTWQSDTFNPPTLRSSAAAPQVSQVTADIALEASTIQLDDSGVPDVVYAREVDFATTGGLYGLYGSLHSAIEALHALADEHRLCLGALGLERVARGRGCFRSMLNRCAGVCCGRESEAQHRARLQAALANLQLVCWPYPGAVAIVERFDDGSSEPLVQWHVVRNWCYLGSASNADEAQALDRVASAFDGDGYKILCKALLTAPSGVDIVEL